MNIRIQTIEKITNELFDHEAKEILTETTSINKDSLIYKSNTLRFIPADVDNANVNGDLIARISKGTNNYVLERTLNNGERLKGRIWLPLCAIPNENTNNKLNDYILHQGDIIKLGKVELKVREIHLEGSCSKQLSFLIKNSSTNYNHNVNENNYINNNQNSSKRICRICFGEDEIESPLINPCKCNGGVKYVHLKCLQEWLQTKCNIKQGNDNSCCSIYTYKKIECELCKTMLPDFIQSGNNLYEIWKFTEPKFSNYITLESIDSKTFTSKTIYIINFQNKHSISIGRKKDSDINIKDISISRHHVTIELTTIENQREVVIKDNNSKFGTLVELQCDKIPIYSGKGMTVQIGKHIVSLWSKCKRNGFSCCLSYNKHERMVVKEIDLNKMNNEHIDLTRTFTLKEEQVDYEHDEKEGNNAKDSTVNEEENIMDDDIDIDNDDDNEINVCFKINKEINLRDKNKEYFGLDDVHNE